ncbi:MAG: hypothetical protein H7263_03750 [Candidatus Sericytochromatia bacterium]|nr:hypothetical protein [Candidatus Sericytochromatia bacterium]
MNKGKNLLKNRVLACFILSLTSCQSNTLIDNKLISKTQSPIIAASIIQVVASSSLSPHSISAAEPVTKIDTDEQTINDIIKNSPDFFPINLQKEESQATVPNNGGVVFATVPNNGGVVFVADSENNSFTTKALIDNLNPTLRDNLLASNIIRNIKQKVVKKVLSRVIKNTIGETQRKVTVKFNKDKTKADVIIKLIYEKELINRDTLKVIKTIKENSVINSVFVKKDSEWSLEQISPIDLQTENKDSGVNLESIKLTIHPKDGSELKIYDLDLDGLKNKDNLLEINRGDIITLEAKLNNKDIEQGLQVFVKFSDKKTHIPLYDDGSQDIVVENSTDKSEVSGDKVKNDQTYTSNIVIKEKAGVNYLTINVDKSASEKDDLNNFSSISKSIAFKIN